MQASDEGILARLRNSGIEPGDSDEIRLQKSLLVFATGLISLASTLWLFIYWQFGPQFSAMIPVIFQLLLIGNLLIYLKSQKFDRFRLTQLLTILCMPFAAQWGMGGFIDASGISLWGLLAPIGAALIVGARPSLIWFIAYVLLVVLSGIFDFFLAEGAAPPTYRLSMQTMAFFFTLNFIAVSTLVYLMIRYATEEKQRVRVLLEEAHQRLQSAQARSERLLLNVLPSTIAERLKHENQTIADGFADVSVMFVDFTRMAEGMTPQQVFAMLNDIFSRFDELAEKHGMEKIKTIGDAYMVAGGMTNDRCGNYTDALVNLALEMRNLLYEDSRCIWKYASVSVPARSSPASLEKRNSSTIFGATPSTLPVVSLMKEARAWCKSMRPPTGGSGNVLTSTNRGQSTCRVREIRRFIA